MAAKGSCASVRSIPRKVRLVWLLGRNRKAFAPKVQGAIRAGELAVRGRTDFLVQATRGGGSSREARSPSEGLSSPSGGSRARQRVNLPLSLRTQRFNATFVQATGSSHVGGARNPGIRCSPAAPVIPSPRASSRDGRACPGGNRGNNSAPSMRRTTLGAVPNPRRGDSRCSIGPNRSLGSTPQTELVHSQSRTGRPWSSVPSCTTLPYTAVSPNLVPPPTGLVVTDGSQIHNDSTSEPSHEGYG